MQEIHEVEVTMEVTYRMAKRIKVTRSQYEDIKGGGLPREIYNDIETDIYNNPEDCDKEIDWAAVDMETGRTLQDWI